MCAPVGLGHAHGNGTRPEVDLDGERVGVEIKRTDRPRPTPMRHAWTILAPDRIIAVHADLGRLHWRPRPKRYPHTRPLPGPALRLTSADMATIPGVAILLHNVT